MCVNPHLPTAGSAVDLARGAPIIQYMPLAAQDTDPARDPAPAGRVLVIDDEPNVASFVGRALRAKGFAVDIALGGERGLEAALEGGHALIVLDLRMRDVNGLVILRQVMRARPEQPGLVLSAASDVEVKVRCLDLGAVDFVAKPFELAELVARVGSHLRRHAQGPAPAPAGRHPPAGRPTPGPAAGRPPPPRRPPAARPPPPVRRPRRRRRARRALRARVRRAAPP